MRNYISILLIISWSISNAQVKLHSHIELGEHKASKGLYVKDTYIGTFQYQDYQIYGGLQLDLYNNRNALLSGFNLAASKDFMINHHTVKLKAHYLLTPYSELFTMNDYSISIEHFAEQHWYFQLGTNIKSYSIRKHAMEVYNVNEADRQLNENFGLIYTISAYLKPHNHDWNACLSISNTDYFLVNQATNPLVSIQSYYKVQTKLKILFEAWYKQAGVLNIQANYFGYLLRGGIVWEL